MFSSAHQYFKSDRLKASETDFNSSFHALGKSFPADFSFLKQVCVRCFKWGWNLTAVFFVQYFKIAPYPVKTLLFVILISVAKYILAAVNDKPFWFQLAL